MNAHQNARNRASGYVPDEILFAQIDRFRVEEQALREQLIRSERALLETKESSEPNNIASVEMSIDDLKRKLGRVRETRIKIETAKEEQSFMETMGSNLRNVTLLDKRITPIKRTLLRRLFE
jgi:hypothetical protein